MYNLSAIFAFWQLIRDFLYAMILSCILVTRQCNSSNV
jgi:hypothetical protein